MHDVVFEYHDHVMIYTCGIVRIDVIHSYCLNLKNQRDYHGPYDTYIVVFSYDYHRYYVIGSLRSLDVNDDVFSRGLHRWKRVLPRLCLG